MGPQLLIVEDDPGIASFLRRGLEAEGYAVKVACDGREALKRATAEDFALIILDRMLPGLSGLDVCTKLRDGGNRSPILMLTAKDTLEDKIEGLKGGADDYLTKPFAFNEMLARVEALLRRSAPAERATVLEVADVRMDLAAKTVWRGGRKISLTAKEFALLAHLMENAGTPVSREELLAKVWKLNFDPGTKVVEVYIRYLRLKIDDGEATPLIQTVRGFGYTISPFRTD
jgi:two-component system, OmpR family, response regulator